MRNFSSIALMMMVFSAIGPLQATEETGKSEPAALETPEADYHAAVDVNATAAEATAKITAQFDTLRIAEKDFKLPPGWPLPLTIRSVENFFAKPLDIPSTATGWADSVEKAESLAQLFTVAMTVLDGPRNAPIDKKKSPPTEIPESAAVPASLQKPIRQILTALDAAVPYLNKAVNSLPAAARSEFLRQNDWANAGTGAVEQEISAQRIKRQYESMKAFSDTDLYTAAQIILKGVDGALPQLAKSASVKKRVRWNTPHGAVLIGGSGDDTYDAAALKNVALLIDMGGSNTYTAPVAAAHENEIRIAIDFGSDITVKGVDDLHGNAGTGAFGIGIMVCPNEDGEKEFSTGPFSQGAGLGGVGILAVNGTTIFSGDRYTQGFGASGVGVLWARNGKSSKVTAVRSGQGSALTRGIGLFLHEGDDADIRGGLVQPDPREPLGSVSMCQGVGFGPRAYAGGGVGIAVVHGTSVSVKGSYFSQGVGYWHGMGVFRLRGDQNTLQARRYDMGSGVHSAFGHFDVFGNANRILNWGVGPSYGWDHAAGSSLIVGDDNEMQTEWGAGTASIGSVSFSYIKGNRNKMKLCDFGTDNFVHDEPAYSAQVIEGMDNRLQCHGQAETGGATMRRLRSPWALFQMTGVQLADNLGLTPPEWPDMPREEAVERAMVDLQQHLADAKQKTPLERITDLVDVAAAFSLDKTSPRQALKELITLPDDQTPFIVDALEPAAVDQLIQLSVALPAHGDATSNAIFNRLANAPLQKKMTMINFLRMGRPATVGSRLLDLAARDPQEDVRNGALRTVAQLLNKDTGNEPGPRAAFEAIERVLKKPGNKKQRKQTVDLLARLRFGEGFGVLASAADLDVEKRMKFFEAAPEDITSQLGEKTANALLNILLGNRRENLRIVSEQLKRLESFEAPARQQLTELLTSTRAATVASGVIGLGQIGNADDAKHVEPLLVHDAARVREAAAVALGRFGEPALAILSGLQSSKEPRTRCLVLVAATQDVSPKAAALIKHGWADNDPMVRLVALTALDNLPDCLRPDRDKLIAEAKKRIDDEEDPEVKLALQLLK